MTRSAPLARIRLRNFKAFERLDIRLAPFTLLVGTNSSGKSSVLHALAAAHQSRDRGHRGLALNGGLVELGTYEDVLFDQLPTKGRADARLEVAFNSQLLRFGVPSLDADFVPLEDPAGHLELPWSNLTYVRADRLTPSLLHLRSSQSAVELGEIGSRGEYAVHQLLRHLDDQVGKNLVIDSGSPATVDAQARAWLNKISPGTRLEIQDLRQAGVAALRFGRQAGVGYIGGGTHRATNVGFGLAYTLPIIVGCLLARRGDLLVIENPEAHLHPRAQTAMASLCVAASRGGVQVVVETHSDHVLNEARLAVARGTIAPQRMQVLYFHRQAGSASPSVNELRVDAAGQFADWPDGFFDEYLRALLELAEHDSPG